MKKTTVIILAITAVVVIAAIIAVLAIRKKKKTNEVKEAVDGATSVTKYTDNTFPLHLYSGGSNVEALQKKLNDKGESLEVDGKFGNLTLAALKKVTGKETITEEEFKNL